MIRIGPSSSRIEFSPEELERMRLQFERSHFVPWLGLLEESLLASILDRLDAAEFSDEPYGGEPKDLLYVLGLPRPELNVRLSFLFNDPRIFAVVRAVTGCPPIDGFIGRVIRMVPGEGHYVRWHYDHTPLHQRVAALRLNLSRNPFAGGHLQFRNQDSDVVVSECADAAAGNAVLFRPHPVLHRNTEVSGDEPKTTFSGWFYREPERSRA